MSCIQGYSEMHAIHRSNMLQIGRMLITQHEHEIKIILLQKL